MLRITDLIYAIYAPLLREVICHAALDPNEGLAGPCGSPRLLLHVQDLERCLLEVFEAIAGDEDTLGVLDPRTINLTRYHNGKSGDDVGVGQKWHWRLWLSTQVHPTGYQTWAIDVHPDHVETHFTHRGGRYNGWKILLQKTYPGLPNFRGDLGQER
jgi:hypothetical protein